MSRHVRPDTRFSLAAIERGMVRGRQLRSESLLRMVRRLLHP